jgi:Zn-dependent protease with chaperone function
VQKFADAECSRTQNPVFAAKIARHGICHTLDMREAKHILFMLVITAAAGCSTHPAAPLSSRATTTPHQAWVRSHGGLAPAPLADRVTAVCRRQLSPAALADCQIHVLDSDAAVAFAWPDRRIYLCRGLVARLTDDELAAAVAHELGHLLDDDHIHHPVTLAGDRAPTDDEARADRLGVALLKVHGKNPAAMTRMLEKVRSAPSTSDATRARLAERINLLRSAGY